MSEEPPILTAHYWLKRCANAESRAALYRWEDDEANADYIAARRGAYQAALTVVRLARGRASYG